MKFFKEMSGKKEEKLKKSFSDALDGPLLLTERTTVILLHLYKDKNRKFLF